MFLAAKGYMGRGGDDQYVEGSCSNTRTFPYWAQLDT
jgi:hypothetical protein